jgi:hypothetical protein
MSLITAPATASGFATASSIASIPPSEVPITATRSIPSCASRAITSPRYVTGV